MAQILALKRRTHPLGQNIFKKDRFRPAQPSPGFHQLIDLMQLKANTYSGQSAFNADVAPILNRYRGKEQQIIDKYDSRSESNHGDNGRGQDKWNRMIHSAFHTPRSPAQSAPDGKAYKLQLLQVLRNNGISI